MVLACSFQRYRVEYSEVLDPATSRLRRKDSWPYLSLGYQTCQFINRTPSVQHKSVSCNRHTVSSCSIQPARVESTLRLCHEFCTPKTEEKGSRKHSACPQRALRTGEGVPICTAQDLVPERKFD